MPRNGSNLGCPAIRKFLYPVSFIASRRNFKCWIDSPGCTILSEMSILYNKNMSVSMADDDSYDLSIIFAFTAFLKLSNIAELQILL